MFWGFYQVDTGLYYRVSMIAEIDVTARRMVHDTIVYAEDILENRDAAIFREIIVFSLKQHQL